MFSLSDIDASNCELLLSRPIESSLPTRWERKAAQAAALQPRTPAKQPSASSSASSTSSSRTPAKTPKTPSSSSDRFIPSRLGASAAALAFEHGNENAQPAAAASAAAASASTQADKESELLKGHFHATMAASLFSGDECSSKVLAFKAKAPRPAAAAADAHTNNLRVLYSSNKDVSAASAAAAAAAKRAFRHVSTSAARILDAPGMADDYYLNLLEWGPQNLLAVALGRSVYLWNAETGVSDLLCESAAENDMITSVSWMQDGSHLAVATAHNADVQMWNIAGGKQVRSMKGHAARVGALAWNQHILSSGSKDATIFHHDVRMPQHHVATLQGHTQEICGLKWSHDGTQLASGGNDNVCAIWDVSRSTPRHTFTDSCAAVKALAWCPWQRNLLATGSGSADRHMRFYNTAAGTLLNSVDTQSQVCSLQWSKSEKEILSAHGFKQNQLSLWKYPTLARVADLTGHSSRVLHTAISPDGTTVASAAADEKLCFWNVWPGAKAAAGGSATTTLSTKGGKLEGPAPITASRFIR